MVIDDETTAVIFRKFLPDGDVIALFPDLRDGEGVIQSYMHVGQHSGASWRIVTDRGCTRLARPEEYADLARELTQIGYRLKVYRRRPVRKQETTEDRVNARMRALGSALADIARRNDQARADAEVVRRAAELRRKGGS